LIFQRSELILFCRVEKPTVHVVPRELNITEGSPALFTCSATGSPQSNITWTNVFSGEVIDGRQLAIKSVQRNDSGDYKCAANNGISGPETDSAFLNLFCK